MSSELKVVQFPEKPAARDIPAALRVLADQIEAEGVESLHRFAWIAANSNGTVNVGILGPVILPHEELYFLLNRAVAQIGP